MGLILNQGHRKIIKFRLFGYCEYLAAAITRIPDVAGYAYVP